MRILRPIVEPKADLLPIGPANLLHRRSMSRPRNMREAESPSNSGGIGGWWFLERARAAVQPEVHRRHAGFLIE
jgi:hypothetical protein